MFKKVSYIIAGLWNTIFAYAFFYLEIRFFGEKANYIILLIISQILGLTNAFIVHKFMVFRSNGNWIKEYLRYYVVYSGSLAINLVSVVLLVNFFGVTPLISQLIVGAFLTIGTYIAHNNFSFKGSN